MKQIRGAANTPCQRHAGKRNIRTACHASLTQYIVGECTAPAAMKTNGGKPTQSAKKKRDVIVKQVA